MVNFKIFLQSNKKPTCQRIHMFKYRKKLKVNIPYFILFLSFIKVSHNFLICKTFQDSTNEYLSSRADTMHTIESTIVELGGIFSQLAHMVKVRYMINFFFI